MITVNEVWCETEEEAHQAVRAESAAYKRDQERWTAVQKRARVAGDEFFVLLRNRQPNLFKKRLISLPVLREHEAAIKKIIREMGRSPKDLMLAINGGITAWPVRVSEAASREFQYWLHEMSKENG